MQLIKNIEELKKEASKESGLDCFISLSGGLCRSSKQIYYDKDSGRFDIYNDIDGSNQSLIERNLAKRTNIVEAIKLKALFKY
jgi:hypothetical protein